MSFLLFEDHSCLDLLPLTYCRPVYDLRAGIFTNLDRWQKYLDTEVFQLCRPYLRTLPPEGFYTWINGKIIPNQEIARMLNDVPENTFYVDQDGEVLCAKGRWEFHDAFAGQLGEGFFTGLGWKAENVHWDGLKICYPEDLFSLNGQLLRQDFDLAVQSGPSSETLSDPHSRVYGVDNLFISPGVKIQAAILNAEDGPIYFGPNSKVQEGAIIHGAHAICESARINMGAKLRGDTTIGPMCKVGGEVANSIMMGYSNKGHEGYLGNSVLG
ncbi:MAG: putative sugar nucleotidyl transferase, partial [Bacteroidota bacterium]